MQTFEISDRERELYEFETLGDPVLESMLSEACQFWLRLYDRQNGAWLSFCGTSGTGKTYLAQRLLKFARTLVRLHNQGDYQIGLRDKAYGARLFFWPEVVERVLSGDFGVLETIKNEWFVVIDDIGTSRSKIAELSTDHLFNVLNHRMGKWTVLTSNLRFKALAELDARIPDRMIRHPNVAVRCDTQSFALRKLGGAQ